MANRTAVAAATALAVLAGAPAASAAWTTPQRFAGSGASNVFAAGNRHGSEVLAWKVTSTRLLRLPTQTGLASSIRARIRLPNGRLGEASTLLRGDAIVAAPQVGVDENGNATAVWAQAGRHVTIMAAFHPHGKPFGKPVEIGRSGAFNGARQAIAVGRFGDAVIAWNDGRHVAVRRYAANAQCAPARHFACYLAGRAPADGRHPAQRSGAGPSVVGRAMDGTASQPAIAVRLDGTADLAWRASLPPGGEQNERAPILAAASGPDAVVSPPQAVSTLRGEDPFIKVTRQGEAIVSWNQSLDAAEPRRRGDRLRGARRGRRRVQRGEHAVGPGMRAAGQSLAVDAAGNAVIAYTGGPATGPTPDGAVGTTHRRPAGAAFGLPQAFPRDATRGLRVFAAGPKISAISGAPDGVRISDWPAP